MTCSELLEESRLISLEDSEVLTYLEVVDLFY